MAEAKTRSCFLFYIYGWFFGLGGGIVSTAFIFVDEAGVPSKALMLSAVGLSILTACVQCLIHCTPCCGRNKKVSRPIVNIVGLFCTCVLTCVGTFLSDNPSGLFFLCSVFSASSYLMACIAFAVNLYQNRNHKPSSSSTQDEIVPESVHGGAGNVGGAGSAAVGRGLGDARSREELYSQYLGRDRYMWMLGLTAPGNTEHAQRVPTLSFISSGEFGYLDLSVLYRNDQERHFSPLGTEGNFVLPSYSQAEETKALSPPQYSELADSTPENTLTDSSTFEGTDPPPDYREIDVGRISEGSFGNSFLLRSCSSVAEVPLGPEFAVSGSSNNGELPPAYSQHDEPDSSASSGSTS